MEQLTAGHELPGTAEDPVECRQLFLVSVCGEREWECVWGGGGSECVGAWVAGFTKLSMLALPVPSGLQLDYVIKSKVDSF